MLQLPEALAPKLYYYKELTQTLANEFFKYDPITGLLTWRKRDLKYFKTHRAFIMWNNRYPGKVAGSKHRKKNHLTEYIRVRVNKINYEYHCIVFLLVFGYVPDQIDHDDGNGLHNELENLIASDAKTNRRNMSKPTTNKTGCIGVFYWKERGKYKAYITINKKTKHLGLYNTLEEARQIRLQAEKDLNFNINHGRSSLC